MADKCVHGRKQRIQGERELRAVTPEESWHPRGQKTRREKRSAGARWVRRARQEGRAWARESRGSRGSRTRTCCKWGSGFRDLKLHTALAGRQTGRLIGVD